MATRGGERTASRGQSSVVGFALLVGLTVAVAGTIVVGSPVLSNVQESVRADQAEGAMTQLDSRASVVALGDSARQRVRLGDTTDGAVSVEPNAGAIRVLAVDDAGSRTIADERLGAITYDTGGATLAYQGGGVWRSDEGGSRMVSPPEYRYRDNTLTFPIIQLTGDRWSGSPNAGVSIRSGSSERLFPTDAEGNPLDEGHVHIEVTSEYHRGWTEFFETRTEGTVRHEPDHDRVTVNLTVPYTETFDSAVAATSGDADAIEGDFDDPQETGADRPSASPEVERAIDDCESGGCEDLTAALGDGVLDAGTYYEDGDVSIDETTYETDDGDVAVVVDGDLALDGSGGSPHHEVTGDGQVTVYVTGDLTVSGNTEVNTGGDAADLHVLAHSDSETVTVRGTAQFTGYVYAPKADLEIKGGGNPHDDNVVGAAVVRNASANGNGNLAYEFPENVEMEFEPIDGVTFLHVTRNEIAIAPD